MAQGPQPSIRNRLLASLPPDVLAALRPHFQHAHLVTDTTLCAAHSQWTWVYFVESGIVSMLATLEEGQQIEVGMAGSEGLVGLSVILGDGYSTLEARVQLEGIAFRISGPEIRAAMVQHPALLNALLRYAQSFMAQTAQTAACNAHHGTEERLARWLLMAHDRAGSNTFVMTHEFMSMMLGLRRPAVTLAAGALQRAGLISYARGQMSVTDRDGLEVIACECHDAIRQEFERLLGADVG